MKKDIRYYEKDGQQFAVIRYTGERTGIVAEVDTATFPYVYYYPHLKLYARYNLIPQYEEMADGCPCLDCGNFIGDNCAAYSFSGCSQIENFNKEYERRRNPKQLTLF